MQKKLLSRKSQHFQPKIGRNRQKSDHDIDTWRQINSQMFRRHQCTYLCAHKHPSNFSQAVHTFRNMTSRRFEIYLNDL
jgi:hypothetical protein